ncbi:MAG: hypothetical protein WCO30_02055 [bacterium]
MKKGQTRKHKTYGLKHQDKRKKPADVTSKEFIVRDEYVPLRDPTPEEIADYEKGVASLNANNPFGVRIKGPKANTFPG